MHLKYVNAIKDRYGNVRFYFRRGGKTYPLPNDETSREFIAEHQRLLGETDPVVLPRKVTPTQGSLNALALLYYASPDFRSITKGTQHNYRASLDRFLLEHGHRRVDQMKRSHVVAIIGAMSDSPGAANYFLKRLRKLFSFAVSIEWIAANPTTGVKGYKAGEFHTWTEAEIGIYEKFYPLGSRQRLAFDILLYSGQRVSDAAPMPVPSTRGRIQVVQQKTGAALSISIHPKFAASIAACPSNAPTILVTTYGKAFSVKGFSNFISDSIAGVVDAKGKRLLPDECVAHGLRKAAARRLAEAGCTDNEIMAVTGHTTLSEVTRYTRAANQERMNQSAMDKLI